METNTYRAIYDNGEVRFAEPMNMEGEWELIVTFVQPLDESTIPIEADPHRHEHSSWSDRLDEAHEHVIDAGHARTNPF